MFVSLCQSAVESLNASKIAPVSLQHGQRYFLSAYLLPLALRKNGLGTRLSLCTSIYGYGVEQVLYSIVMDANVLSPC